MILLYYSFCVYYTSKAVPRMDCKINSNFEHHMFISEQGLFFFAHVAVAPCLCMRRESRNSNNLLFLVLQEDFLPLIKNQLHVMNGHRCVNTG